MSISVLGDKRPTQQALTESWQELYLLHIALPMAV